MFDSVSFITFNPHKRQRRIQLIEIKVKHVLFVAILSIQFMTMLLFQTSESLVGPSTFIKGGRGKIRQNTVFYYCMSTILYGTVS